MGVMSARNLAPDDAPIAPSRAEWDAMSPAERERVVASLPYVVGTVAKRMGDFHARVVDDTVEALRNRYVNDGPGSRRMYVGRSLTVNYPKTPVFAPDVFLVLDVADDPRASWDVAREGRGVDVAFDVLWRAESVRDCALNDALYAMVGIPEYFVFDMNRMVITGHRLEPGEGTYRPIMAQRGRVWSEVLGLEIAVCGHEFRFFIGEAMLPTDREVLTRLRDVLAKTQRRWLAPADRAAAEAERAAAEAEARVRALEAQLAALLAGQKPS